MLQGMVVHAEVSSSCSTVEVYESRWRKGFNGRDRKKLFIRYSKIAVVRKRYLFEGRLEIKRKELERLESRIGSARHR